MTHLQKTKRVRYGFLLHGRCGGSSRRQGAALLLALFVMFFVSMMVVHVYDSEMLQQSVLRNYRDYETALYLANAGLHHAAAELEADTSWRDTVSDGGYPASGSYQATGVDGVIIGTVDVTSTGVAGSVTRKLEAVIQIN